MHGILEDGRLDGMEKHSEQASSSLLDFISDGTSEEVIQRYAQLP